MLDGALNPDPGAAHDVAPGWIASLAASWTILPESGGPVPFLSASVSLGVVGTTTSQAVDSPSRSLVATDARVALVAGKTLFDVWTPYLVGRAFAGPVFWTLDGEEQTGGDQHHFQLGVGSVLACPRGFDVVIEWAPLGARGFTGGVGYAF